MVQWPHRATSSTHPRWLARPGGGGREWYSGHTGPPAPSTHDGWQQTQQNDKPREGASQAAPIAARPPQRAQVRGHDGTSGQLQPQRPSPVPPPASGQAVRRGRRGAPVPPGTDPVCATPAGPPSRHSPPILPRATSPAAGAAQVQQGGMPGTGQTSSGATPLPGGRRSQTPWSAHPAPGTPDRSHQPQPMPSPQGRHAPSAPPSAILGSPGRVPTAAPVAGSCRI